MTDELEIVLGLDEPEEVLVPRAAAQLGIPAAAVRVRLLRRSLDARRGAPPRYRYRVAVERVPSLAPAPSPTPAETRSPRHAGRHVAVVGSGPAGTFAAFALSEAGVGVTVIELGKPVQPRRHDLAALTRGRLDPDSNYCFGEGGAGTFSDGKLYTRTKDRAGVARVLDLLMRFGASPDIAIDARPHIGSNRLPKILLALRAELERRGVTYCWSDPVIDLLRPKEAGRVAGVRLRSGRELTADAVVLAVGHSARPIYELAARLEIAAEPKPFAVGVRVEHPQPLIDELQYGSYARHPRLPPAFYHVTAQVAERGVYSFCMCPGGWIVPSATEPSALVTNGMSLSRRDSPFANAALVVTVSPADFPPGLLGGVELQRQMERAAFALGGGDFRAPAQRLEDFLRGRASSSIPRTSYRPGAVAAELTPALPGPVAYALGEAVRSFAKRMPPFVSQEALLVGVETRTSAPVRLLRDSDTLESLSHRNLYPCGEGAGYAGGIVSAALDGLRVAERLIGRLGATG